VTVVVDASAVVAALLDKGPVGVWAVNVMTSDNLVAPHHMPAEATRAIRRAVLSGEVSEADAAKALVDLLALRVTLFGFRQVANRVWGLRHTVTAADAWYVALAEDLSADLATIDGNLARAPGPRCRFLTPPV
jgi:predicted nucleic acid-binding protein